MSTGSTNTQFMTKAAEEFKLDKRDRRILALLSENSRIPVTEIAKYLKLNKDTVRYKIIRLEKLGIIERFHAEIDLLALGFCVFQVFFRLEEYEEEKVKVFIETIKKHPHTKALNTFHDNWDIEWIVVVHDIKQLDQILWDITGKQGSIIEQRNILTVVDYYRTTNVASSFYPEERHIHRQRHKTEKQITITNKDFKILKLLSLDSRMPALEIAKEINMSVDAVIDHIKKLYDSKVIEKFTIQVNGDIIRHNRYVFALRLRYFDKKQHEKLTEFIKMHPYIFRCVRVYGSYDLLFYVSAEKGEQFHQAIVQIKKEFADIIKDYETWVIYQDKFYNYFPPSAFAETDALFHIKNRKKKISVNVAFSSSTIPKSDNKTNLQKTT